MSKPGRQLNLLDWIPPQVAETFEPALIRAESLKGRLSRAVAATLKGRNREEIASEMSDFLDEGVSAGMLSAYASQAREDNTISAVRLIALVHATGDIRLLQVLMDPLDQVAVPSRLLPAIEEAMLTEKIEQLTEAKRLARGKWKGGR